MRLVSWNVNGVRAVHARGDLAWAFTDAHDVICLQEIKASEDQLDDALRAPDGYTAVWNPATKKGYSGVATFVRDGVPARIASKGLDDPRFDDEGRVIVTDHDAFLLYNVYFPNGGRSDERLRYKLDFYARFLDVISTHLESGREVVICGDVNTAHTEVDIYDPARFANVSGFLVEERKFIDALLARGFVDTLRSEVGLRPAQYTWWDVRFNLRPLNKGWRIDYFFVSEGLDDSLVDAWTSPQIMGSDHCPVGIELDL
jgi:exodeoxyribonuclease-3